MRMNRPDVRVHLALISVSTIFGINAVTSKVALREIDSFALVFFRISIAAGILYLAHRWLIKEKIHSSADYFRLMLYSIFGIVINQTLFLKGLALTTAVNAAILVTSIPVLTILIAIGLGRERFGWMKIIGSLISLAGVVLLFGTERIDFQNVYFVGNLLVFINGASYAVYLVISKDILKRYHPLTVTTWTFIFGSIGVFPFTIGPASETDYFSISLTAYVCIAFLIFFASVIVYFINSWALQRTTSSMVAMYIYIQPLIAMIISAIWLEEPVYPGTILASILIFAGVLIVSRMTQKESMKEKNKRDHYVRDSVLRLED